MLMKITLTISMLIFSLKAYSLTIDDLQSSYGKHAIMDVLSVKLGNRFTVVNKEGSPREITAPNPDFINAGTLTRVCSKNITI